MFKKNYLLITILFLISNILFSQKDSLQSFFYGAKANFNLAYIPEVLEEVKENKPKIGFSLGVFLGYQISDKIDVQIESIYSQQGTNAIFIVDSDPFLFELNSDFSFNYLNIPLVFHYEVFKNLKLGTGPYLGFLLSNNAHIYTDSNQGLDIDLEGTVDEVSDQLSTLYAIDIRAKKTDFGLIFNSEYVLSPHFSLSGRFSLGLTNLLEGESFEAEPKNSVFSLGLSYIF